MVSGVDHENTPREFDGAVVGYGAGDFTLGVINHLVGVEWADEGQCGGTRRVAHRAVVAGRDGDGVAAYGGVALGERHARHAHYLHIALGARPGGQLGGVVAHGASGVGHHGVMLHIPSGHRLRRGVVRG